MIDNFLYRRTLETAQLHLNVVIESIHNLQIYH